MKLKFTLLLAILMAATAARTQDQEQERPVPNIADFYNATSGNYQVFAQDSMDTAWQVNRFMNEMLRQYSSYFSNWTQKDSARVIVFSNAEDFRAYAKGPVSFMHAGLAGYCHLKTDEDGNTFYELVTFVHDNVWQVLAHEGFHQFIGYELGMRIPTWLNEGMAQYFETSYVAYGRLQTGLISSPKLRAAQYFIRTGKAPTATDLLQMDRQTFYGNPQVNYPMSWALVYYLMMRDGSGYTYSRFHRYLQDLKFNLADPAASFQHRFGRDSYQWENDFQHYVLRLQPSYE